MLLRKNVQALCSGKKSKQGNFLLSKRPPWKTRRSFFTKTANKNISPSGEIFLFGAPQGTRTPNLRGRKSHAFPTFLGLIVCFLQLFYNLLYLCMNLYIMVESGGKPALLRFGLSIIRQVFPFLPSP